MNPTSMNLQHLKTGSLHHSTGITFRPIPSVIRFRGLWIVACMLTAITAFATPPSVKTVEKAKDAGPVKPASQPSLAPHSTGLDADTYETILKENLTSNTISQDEVAVTFLKLLPRASLDQQIELSQHVMVLISDENFTRVRDLLLDPTFHSDVKEVLYANLLNRESEFVLPILAAIAKQPGNPFMHEAIDTLSIILEPEIASNPALIEPAVKKHLEELKKSKLDLR